MFGSRAAIFATKSLNPLKDKPLTENRCVAVQFWDGYNFGWNSILIWLFFVKTVPRGTAGTTKTYTRVNDRSLMFATTMCEDGRSDGSFTQHCAGQTKTTHRHSQSQTQLVPSFSQKHLTF